MSKEKKMSRDQEEEYGPWKLGKCVQEEERLFRGFNTDTGEIVSIKKIPVGDVIQVLDLNNLNFRKILHVIKTEEYWIIVQENLEDGKSKGI